MRVFITGTGILSAAGRGNTETRETLQKNITGIKPLRLFSTSLENAVPVGEVDHPLPGEYPRTHELALIAAEEALEKSPGRPDAVVLGVTTGGMLVTEELIREKNYASDLYRYHGLGTVAGLLARKTGCRGPVITITTACSSGTAAVKIALELIRTGRASRVLAGGADSLCRLTVYGFNSLQLLDPEGARPMDRERRGMSVAEGAAMLLLEAGEGSEKRARAEVLGGGLSCDAYHPTAPHPEGLGALRAMERALADAGLKPDDIEYINLHGTGTRDNDLSEARAVSALFGDEAPVLSSVKGAFGHTLGAAGAVEAVVSTLAITGGFIPGNTGCGEIDPGLGVKPVLMPVNREVMTVLSNSFGFGGNNASCVIAKPGFSTGQVQKSEKPRLRVAGYACVTGAGNTEKTVEAVRQGRGCVGMLPLAEVSAGLPPKAVRRMKRQPRLVLSAATEAARNAGLEQGPSSVFLATAWGSMSESVDFLDKLYETEEQFTSPIDFTGSVHNAPAGHVAMKFSSTGSNITTTGGDGSFDQALLCVELLCDNEPSIMLIGSEEFHEKLSPASDPSMGESPVPSDGCGALLLQKGGEGSGPFIAHCFFEGTFENETVVGNLVSALGGGGAINEKYGALFAGVPLADREEGERLLDEFVRMSGFSGPAIDYRTITGEYPAASAVAAVLAAHCVEKGEIPEGAGGTVSGLGGRGVLVAGFGRYVTAFEILP